MLSFASLQFGQSTTLVVTGDTGAKKEAAASGPATAPAAESEGLLSRWLEIDTFTASLRYRNTENTGGFHPFNYGQHREILGGRFKLDKEGNYSINFHASSGRYFNWAFADMLNGQFSDGPPHAGKYRPADVSVAIGRALKVDPLGHAYAVGINSRGGYIYLRQLYFSATPVKQVTFEVGSLPIERGESSEITTFDEDGYIAGERVRVHDDKHLFFSEIDATWAYLGYATEPNFFARGAGLTKNNYQQYLVKKKFGRMAASTDYTILGTTKTLREAVMVKVPETHFIDSAKLELYQRLGTVNLYGINYAPGSGMSASAIKTFAKRFQLEGGYASIDKNYGVYTDSPFLAAVGFAWNSDSFMVGSKAFTRGNLKIAPGLSFFGFFSHEVAPYQHFLTNRQTTTGGITLDMADLLHRGRIL